MEQSAFSFPKPLGAVISRLPVFPPSFAFVQILNLALGRIIRKDYLEPLHGKQIAIHIKDLGLGLYFTVTAEKFVPTLNVGQPDIAFRATAQDFFLLATRKEDPDTLFFSRRLVVEGDTELGLVAKNTLDAIDMPQITPELFSPRNVVTQLRSRLFGH
ncbi:MAG: SCP2 sterol-binding domain-containing protein [Gallionella sp.]